MIIEKRLQTDIGECRTEAFVDHASNGMTTVTVSAEMEGHSHEHRITVGATDGKDRLRELTDEELKETLQKHLDQVRCECSEILKSRIRVKKLTGELL